MSEGASPSVELLKEFDIITEKDASSKKDELEDGAKRRRERERNMLRLFGFFSSECVQENSTSDSLQHVDAGLAYSCALIQAAESLIQTCQNLRTDGGSTPGQQHLTAQEAWDILHPPRQSQTDRGAAPAPVKEGVPLRGCWDAAWRSLRHREKALPAAQTGSAGGAEQWQRRYCEEERGPERYSTEEPKSVEGVVDELKKEEASFFDTWPGTRPDAAKAQAERDRRDCRRHDSELYDLIRYGMIPLLRLVELTGEEAKFVDTLSPGGGSAVDSLPVHVAHGGSSTNEAVGSPSPAGEGGKEGARRHPCLWRVACVYRFPQQLGGQGGTVLAHLILLPRAVVEAATAVDVDSGPPHTHTVRQSTEASLLAARYVLSIWPGLLLDRYASPPPKTPPKDKDKPISPYHGETMLHLLIVKKRPEMLIFIERCVWRGLVALRYLGGCTATGEFFSEAGTCPYGGFPLSFAAATGSSYWFFKYLVLRLKVDILDKKKEFGNATALHVAVLHNKNESYRYLLNLLRQEGLVGHRGTPPGTRTAEEILPHLVEKKSELIGDVFRNAYDLTPLQLAALTAGRCTQAPVPLEESQMERPRVLGMDERNEYMLSFCLQLHAETAWTFGGVQRVRYPVTQILEGWRPHVDDEHLSALQIVCEDDEEGPAILCPPNALDFVPAVRHEWTRWILPQADDDVDPKRPGDPFRVPTVPGKTPPPMETMLLLFIAERAWRRFGWILVLAELFFFSGFLAVAVLVLLDRTNRSPQLCWHSTNGRKRVAYALDALLLFLSGAFLFVLVFRKISWWPSLHAYLRVLLWGRSKKLSAHLEEGFKKLWSTKTSAVTERGHGQPACWRPSARQVQPADEQQPAPRGPESSRNLDAAGADPKSWLRDVRKWFREIQRTAYEAQKQLALWKIERSAAFASSSKAKWFREIQRTYEAQKQLALWKIERSAAFASSSKAGGVELVYQVLLAAMCCCIGAAAIHRINIRHRGWPSPFESQPRDAELLTCGVWMGFLHLLYYIRCWSFVGRLSVTLVKMMVDDVFKLLLLYSVILVGYSISFRAILFADRPSLPALLAADPDVEADTRKFETVRESLFTTGMLTMAEWRTAGMLSTRSDGLSLLLYISYVLIINLLILNLLIALLNNTFSSMSMSAKASQVLQRTRVVLQLERAYFSASLRRRRYEEFLERAYFPRTQEPKRLDPETAAGTQLGDSREKPGTAGNSQEQPGTAGGQPGDSCREKEPEPRLYVTIDHDRGRDADGAGAVRYHGEEIDEHQIVDAEVFNRDLQIREGIPAASAPGSNSARAESEDEKKLRGNLEKFVRNGVLDPARQNGVGVGDEEAAAFTWADILLVVDPQNAFHHDGEMKMEGVETAIKNCNALIRSFEAAGATIAFTQDFHPPGHASFASTAAASKRAVVNAGGANPAIRGQFGTLESLWPDHCVQGTKGSEFSKLLCPWGPRGTTLLPAGGVVVRKGFRPRVDSFSAFFELDRCTATGLEKRLLRKKQKLRESRPQGEPVPAGRLFVVGLAFDYGVRYSAEDATLLCRASLAAGTGDGVRRLRRNLSNQGAPPANAKGEDCALRSPSGGGVAHASAPDGAGFRPGDSVANAISDTGAGDPPEPSTESEVPWTKVVVVERCCGHVDPGASEEVRDALRGMGVVVIQDPSGASSAAPGTAESNAAAQ